MVVPIPTPRAVMGSSCASITPPRPRAAGGQNMIAKLNALPLRLEMDTVDLRRCGGIDRRNVGVRTVNPIQIGVVAASHGMRCTSQHRVGVIIVTAPAVIDRVPTAAMGATLQ